MATPDEEKKRFKAPYSIYAKGTPTERIQSKTPSVGDVAGNTFQAAANVAENYAGGAGLRQIVSPVVNARNKQKQYFQNKEINAMPDAVATADSPHGKVTNVNSFKPPVIQQNTSGMAMAADIPVNATTAQEPKMFSSGPLATIPSQTSTQIPGENRMVPGSGWIRNESTGESVSIGPGGKIMKFGKDGRPIDKLSTKIGMKDSSQYSDSPRTFKRGNLDVTFDKSVDVAAQKRFLANPVRPTAQINRFEAQRGNDANQGQLASNNADRIINGSGEKGGREINTFGDVMRAKRDMAVNRQKETERNNLAENILDAQKTENSLDIGKERNIIDAQNVAGSNAERQSQIEANSINTSRQKQIASLQDQYMKEQDPGKKKVIEDNLRALGSFKDKPKQQIVTKDEYDDLGNKIGQSFYTPDENGQLVQVQVDPGAASSIDLPKDPVQRQVGKIYNTAKGPALWDGKGLILQ